MLDGAALTPLLDCQWLRSEILCLSFHMLASFPIIDTKNMVMTPFFSLPWSETLSETEVAVDEKEQH